MRRPTAVTVFGALNIAFAVLGFFGLLMTFAMLYLMNPRGNPALKMMVDNPGYMEFTKYSTILGVIANFVLLASGIGLLGMKPWARTAAIGYAIYAIIGAIVGTVFSYLYVIAPMIEQARGKAGPEMFGAIGGAIGGIIGGVFGIAYPIILLVFMMRPNVVAAFRSADRSVDDVV